MASSSPHSPQRSLATVGGLLDGAPTSRHRHGARAALRGGVAGMIVAGACAGIALLSASVTTLVAGVIVAAGAMAGGLGGALQAYADAPPAPATRRGRKAAPRDVTEPRDVTDARPGESAEGASGESRDGASGESPNGRSADEAADASGAERVRLGARPGASDRDALARRLREQQQEHRVVVENVVDVISRHAPDTTCLYVTASVESLLGYTPEALIGEKSINLVHPDDAGSVGASVQAVLNGAVDQKRARLRHRDGSYVWVEITGRLRRDPETGEPLDLVASTRDVTRRVRAERALRESEVRFRQLAENVEGVFWLATPRTMLYVSPSYERLWGRSVESLYDDPTSHLDAVHPDDEGRVSDRIRTAIREHAPFEEEYRIVRPDDSVRWVHMVCNPVPSQALPGDAPEQRYAGYAVDVTDWKQQQEALRQSEDRWRRLVETHMEPILITVGGEIRYINPSGAELFGAESPDVLTGRSVLDFVAESYAPDVSDRIDRLLSGEATDPFVNRVRRLDGETRVVESQSVPIRYDGEQAAQTVLRDVTEWRDAQSKLEHRILFDEMIVDLSKQLIDTAADITDARIETALGRIGPFVGADRSYVFMFDEAEDTISNTHEWVRPGVSPQKNRLQGVPASAFPWLTAQLRNQRSVHVPDVESLPPEAAAEQAELLRQDVRSFVGVPMHDGRRLLGFVGFDAVDQMRVWTQDTIMVLRVLGDTFANALARKDAEQALREREAQYRTVVENVRDVVFQTDAAGRWTFLNPAWERITGYSVEESLGQRCTETFTGGEMDVVQAVFVEGTRAACRCEVKLQHSDGTVRWMALFAQATTDDDATRTGVAGTLHDITERKRMEQRTRAALQRERELNRLKSSFVSMVSHEFRTPLSTMRSSAEMLMRYFDRWSADKRDKHLLRLRRQIDRMSRLLGDVITTSKLDAQFEAPSLETVDVHAFIREVVEEAVAARNATVRNGPSRTASHAASDRTDRVRLDLGGLPSTLDVDDDLLRHILSNLLSNALKYSPDDTPVHLSARTDADALCLRVSDRGIGIPQEDVPNLFEAFHRAGNVGVAEGSGLGMTIVKRAVDVYNGAIEIDTDVEEGTTFTVTLPVAPPGDGTW